MFFTRQKYFQCILVTVTCLSAAACSNGGWIIKSDFSDHSANRSPASSEPTYMSVAPLVGNPCSSMRYLQQEASKYSKSELYRCNVVLNPKLNPNSKFATQDADFCISLSEHKDDRNNLRPFFQLNGLLLSLKSQENQHLIKNMLVRSSRMAGEAYEKSNELDFQKAQNVTKVTDLIPLSGSRQMMQFDHDKKVLSYEVFENKELSLLKVVEEPVHSVSVRLQCSLDVLYPTVSKNFVTPDIH